MALLLPEWRQHLPGAVCVVVWVSSHRMRQTSVYECAALHISVLSCTMHGRCRRCEPISFGNGPFRCRQTGALQHAELMMRHSPRASLDMWIAAWVQQLRRVVLGCKVRHPSAPRRFPVRFHVFRSLRGRRARAGRTLMRSLPPQPWARAPREGPRPQSSASTRVATSALHTHHDCSSMSSFVAGPAHFRGCVADSASQPKGRYRGFDAQVAAAGHPEWRHWSRCAACCSGGCIG